MEADQIEIQTEFETILESRVNEYEALKKDHLSKIQRLKIQSAMRECIRRFFMKEITLGIEKQKE